MDRNDFERLVDMTLMDGLLTEQEQRVLIQRASEVGITPDELQIMIDAKMQEKQITNQKEQAVLNQNQVLASTLSSALKAEGGKKGRPTKCHNCGASLDSYSSKCPQCGADIDDGEESRGINITKFSEMLTASKDVEERINVIKYAAMPATKTGLLDFITFINAQFKAVSGESELSIPEKAKLRNAWLSKADEISNKANLVLKNDAEAKSVIEQLIIEMSTLNDSFKKKYNCFLCFEVWFVKFWCTLTLDRYVF